MRVTNHTLAGDPPSCGFGAMKNADESISPVRDAVSRTTANANREDARSP